MRTLRLCGRCVGGPRASAWGMLWCISTVGRKQRQRAIRQSYDPKHRGQAASSLLPRQQTHQPRPGLGAEDALHRGAMKRPAADDQGPRRRRARRALPTATEPKHACRVHGHHQPTHTHTHFCGDTPDGTVDEQHSAGGDTFWTSAGGTGSRTLSRPVPRGRRHGYCGDQTAALTPGRRLRNSLMRAAKGAL